jgi:hypothetical protein
MNVHFIYKFTSSARINVFHYCMFHGEARRRGLPEHKNPCHHLGDELTEPIELSRPGTRVPDIFMPRTNLIVSEDVRRVLAPFSGIVFYPVVFSKLIDCTYKAGDLSYYDTHEFHKDPRKHDPEKLIARMPDVPAFHEATAKYFEIVSPWHETLLGTAGNAVMDVPIRVIYLGDEYTSHLQLSEPLLRAYPIIASGMADCGPGIIIRSDVYQVLFPHFDWDYFAQSEGHMKIGKHN